MPMGPGTYGKKRGRPANSKKKKKKTSVKKKGMTKRAKPMRMRGGY